MGKRSFLRSVMLGGACALAIATSALAQPKNFDIPGGDLKAALEAYAQRAGIQIVYPVDQVEGVHSAGVKGALEPLDALERLLKGTGFVVRKDETGAIAVIRASSMGASAGRAHAQQGEEVTPIPSKRAEAAQQASQNETTAEIQTRPETVVVTGTHIAGTAPVGSPLKTYSRVDIDQSGAATLDQFARDMPENFSGADAIANNFSMAQFARVGQGTTDNVFGASTFNLHGLGPDSTLTLLNGMRLAPAGLSGSLTDISQIPLSIVDHIDVLTDGASAIYGTDAVAGVVNIVTRTDFDGEEASVRYGAATDGGAGEFTGSGLIGKTWDGGNALINYEYDNQDGLDASQRSWIPAQGGPFSLIPAEHRNSVFLLGHQDLWSGAVLSAQAYYSNRDYSSVTTEVSVPLKFVSTDDSHAHATQQGVDIDLDAAIAGDWRGNVTVNYSGAEQDLGLLGDFTLSGKPFLTDVSTEDVNTGLLEVDAIANGSVIQLPAGPVKAAIGTSFRDDMFGQKFIEFSNGKLASATTTGEVSSASRNLSSAFAELSAPLIGDSNALPLVQRLEVSSAVRYDDYSDFGATTNGKFGALWEPISGIDVRTTYGTSFRAPELDQLYETTLSQAEYIPDANVPGGKQDGIYVSGGNPGLQPEKSRAFTAGLDIKPDILPDFSATVDYFRVDFAGRIGSPLGSQALSLSNPTFAPFITFNPSLAQVQSYFSSAGFTGDHVGSGPAGVLAILNNQLTNVAAEREAGLDLSLQYALPTELGNFDFTFAGTDLLENRYQDTGTSAPFSLINIFGEPVAWKLRGGIAWTQDSWQSAVNVNYVGSYKNSQFNLATDIASWTTVDFYLSYRVKKDDSSSWLAGTTVAFSVQNIFDQKPPYVAPYPGNYLTGVMPAPYDPTNASPIGRFISLKLTKDFDL